MTSLLGQLEAWSTEKHAQKAIASELTERLVLCNFLLGMMLHQKQLIVSETGLVWTIQKQQ